VLKEKSVSETEPDIDINCSSTKKINEDLIEKEEEQPKRKKNLLWHPYKHNQEKIIKEGFQYFEFFFSIR